MPLLRLPPLISFPVVEVFIKGVGRSVLSNKIEEKSAPADHLVLAEEVRRHFDLLHISIKAVTTESRDLRTYIACL